MAAFASLCISGYSQQNEWTWMGGSQLANQPGVYGLMGEPARGNIPGARWLATHWVDREGNMWVFGGASNNATEYGQEILNDLWKFNPATNEWTWMGGSSLNTGGHHIGPTAVYGTKGVFAPENWPGGHSDAAGWVDKQGHFWLFGGGAIDHHPPPKPDDYQFCYVNEMWEYDPATNEWAWITGSEIGTNAGTSLGKNPGQNRYGIE